jgi:hypothetical protein
MFLLSARLIGPGACPLRLACPDAPGHMAQPTGILAADVAIIRA